VKAVPRKDSLEDEPCPGGLVASPNGRLPRKTPEEAADLHEVTGEGNDFGLLGVAIENSGGDRIEMDIETNPCILVHGWIPPRKKVECCDHSCGPGQYTTADQSTENGGSSRFYMI